MNLRTTIQQNQVASFVLITLVLSFAAMLLPASDESALVGLLFVLALCPAVAAFGLVGFTDGRRGLVALLRETFRWRSPLRWYVSALLVAFGLHVGASVLAVVSGRMAAVTLSAPTPYLIAILPLALFEEIGWRGFALRRLFDRHSPFVATLIVGIPWALIHIALTAFVLVNTGGRTPVWEGLAVFFGAYLLTWVFIRSRRNVLVATVFHAGLNAFGSIAGPGSVLSVEDTLMLQTVTTFLIVAAVIALDWRTWFARPKADTAVEVIPTTA